MNSTIARTAPYAQRSLSRILTAGLRVAVGAALVNVAVFMLTRDFLGIPFVFPYQGPAAPAAALPVTLVIISSMAGAVGATLLLAALTRLTRHALRIFQVVGILFLIGSFGGPLSLPVGSATKLALSTMHVIAAAIIIGGLSAEVHGWARQKRRAH